MQWGNLARRVCRWKFKINYISSCMKSFSKNHSKLKLDLSCAEGPRPGCSTPSGSSQGQIKGGQSSPLTCCPLFCWCGWLSGLQTSTVRSCHPPETPSSSLQYCSQWDLPVCSCLGLPWAKPLSLGLVEPH